MRPCNVVTDILLALAKVTTLDLLLFYYNYLYMTTGHIKYFCIHLSVLITVININNVKPLLSGMTLTFLYFQILSVQGYPINTLQHSHGIMLHSQNITTLGLHHFENLHEAYTEEVPFLSQ